MEKRTYQAQDLVSIAKREQNKKRTLSHLCLSELDWAPQKSFSL